MALFDFLKKSLESAFKKETAKAMNNSANNTGKGRNYTEKFTFATLPSNVDELKALPEATLDTAFKTTSLVILALNRYDTDPNEAVAMLSFLKGPETFNGKEQDFLKDRLTGKGYKARSFLGGATADNNYTPNKPYTVTVSENPYSFDEENWATMYVTSGGADNPRPIKLRKKPSTGQWFLNDIQCLADVRIPKSDDKWA